MELYLLGEEERQMEMHHVLSGDILARKMEKVRAERVTEGGISSCRVAQTIPRGWHLSRELNAVKDGPCGHLGTGYYSGSPDLGPEEARHCVCGTLIQRLHIHAPARRHYGRKASSLASQQSASLSQEPFSPFQRPPGSLLTQHTLTSRENDVPGGVAFPPQTAVSRQERPGAAMP